MNDATNNVIIYLDDAVFYYSNSAEIDLTAPSAATAASATTSSISWTNGSDTGTGATGIQQTLIFKRTSGSDDDLTLNDQGIYSLTSTEGPSTDQSGHWTLVSASVAADATSYSGTFTSGERYAIVHRDLAYNYSTPTYVTVEGASAPTAPTFTYDSTVRADQASIAGAHTGDVVRIDAESGKYIYADWSSSTSQAKTYVFDSGKTAKNQNYYEAVITSGGTRVIYAVAGVNNDGTGASSDLTYIQFTGVTPQNPTFSVAEGSVAKNSTLELTAGYNQDKIYYTYTTDGNEPADPTTSSTLYSSALNIFTADNTTYKIKAVAYDKDGNNPSSVILKTYTTPAAAGLAISTQPVGNTYTQNASATALSVAATGGTGSYSYQWYSNTASSTTTPTPTAVGTNSASYTPSTATVGTTYYYCVVTDNASATVNSTIVAITVKGATENEPSSPATATYASKTFLDVSGTKANGELSDGSKDFLTYGARNIGYTVKPSWYSGTNSKWDSGVTGNITGSGFLPFGGSSSYDNYTSTYGGLKLNATSSTFYVTGTTGVAIYASGASSTNPLTKIDLTVEEVNSDGTTTAVGTTVSTPTNNTLTIVEHGSVLDATKYYKVTATADNAKECHLVQIRFTKGTAATYAVNVPETTDHGSISSNVSSAAAGATVTITATPDTDYYLSNLSVTQTGTTTPVSTTGTGNSRTFTMPAYAVDVTATFTVMPSISITETPNEGGDVTTSPAGKAAPGTMVTIDADAASNYSVGTITVEDANHNNITVTDNQFTMPNSNVTVTVTFNAAAISAGDKWNFTTMSDADKAAYKADDTNWNTSRTDYYGNKFTPTQGTATGIISEDAIQQIKNLKFIRTTGGNMNANDVRIYLPTSTAEGYLKFNGNGRGLIIDKDELSTDDEVTVDFIGGSASKGFTITNGSVDAIKSETRTSAKFTVTDGEQDLQLVVNDGAVKLYKITIGQAVDVAEPSFSKADGSGYDGTGNLSVTVTTNETGEGTETTYWKYATTALDRDALVATGAIDGTATIAKEDVNEQTIVLSAVTKYVTGSNTYYSDVVTASYPYTGTKTLGFNVADMNVPVGGQQTFAPTFTYKDGTEFDPEEDTANPDLQNIYDYFDFTFTQTGNTNDPQANLRLVEGGVVIAKAVGTNGANATVGSELTVDIRADKKTGITSWPFDQDSYTVTGVKATVVERGESGAHMDFWWDPTFTNHVERYTDWDQGTGDDASVSIFSTPYPNGRMIYLEVEDGWTAYVAAGLADKSAKIIKTGNQNEWDKTNKVNYLKYRRNDPTDVYPDVDVPFNGLPLVVEDNDWGSDTQKTFYVNIKTVDANGKEGSPVKARYIIQKDDSYRPAAPTLTPSELNAQRNTAQTVLTKGAEGAYIYGKFGGGYTVPNLVNSEGINGGRTSVGVFSTEVADRKITAVQVGTGLGTTTDNYFYVSKEINNTYKYLFASEISLKSNTYTTNVWNGEDPAVTVNVKALIDKITYYNKTKGIQKDINIADSIQARSGETAQGLKTTEKDRVTYSIERFNGADDTSVDANGLVTIGQHSGYVVVTATYPGGYKKTVSGNTSTTDVSKATYTIYLVNPNEEIPTITPGSRNFVGEQSFMIQAPANWNALYMVVPSTDTDENGKPIFANPTFDSSDTSSRNCTLLKAGEYIRLTVTETSKVRAYAYDPNPKEGQEITTSKEVTATYTKLQPLEAPTLSPYGTSEEPHIRTAKSLTVIATTNDPVAGLEVYYTLDGSDPTPTTGEKYNGSEKINISGASTTIKAITYDPASGRISPITTGVYMYTGSIKQPKFQVNGTGDYYTSGDITVSPGDEITITSDDGGDIYYTLDGATPTTDDAVPYTTSFTIVKNTTGKAIAVKDDASSPITTVNFKLAEEKDDLWEAVEETTPSGKMAAGDRYVSTALKEAGTSTTSSKAVKYLTATFGGMDGAMDGAGWNKTSIGEKTQGSPLDGVGKYSISTTRDVWDETNAEVKNTANTVHGKTFALPAKGNFVRFEPERDGDLTIWLLQQGGLHYTDDGGFCNQFIRLRPVYMFDEKGTSIPADAIKSSARLSDNWNDLDVSDTENAQGRFGNWVAINKSQNGVVNKYYTEDQSEKIYNMYKSHLTTGGNDISSGDPIAPFVVPDGDVKNMLSTLGLTGYGYVMPSGGNVKYTFHVEGGKSYYFFGYRTKLAVRGFQFKPSNEQDVETLSNTVIMNDNASNATSGFDNNICNVTYNRKFKANTWAGITLPFSVSVAQMKKVFGDHVDLIHFDNVSGSKINFKRHWYPMIVAGTPVLIKPSKENMGESVTFEGVHYEASSVNDIVPATGTYNMTGSFGAATLNIGDYYVSTNDGSLKYMTTTTTSGKSCRAWLTPKTPTGARSDLGVLMADAFGEEAWSVIGNPQPFVASDETVVTYINGVQEDGIISNIFDGPTGIYTINGQLIRKDATSLEGLSKGIYIVNGKKIAIK